MVQEVLSTLNRRLEGVSPRDIARKGIRSTVVLSRFRDGFIDAATFRRELTSLGYQPDEITRYLISATIELDTNLRSELLSAYRSAYRHNRLDLNQFHLALIELGVQEDMIGALVFQEQARQTLDEPQAGERDLRAMGSGTVLRRYREGLILSQGFADEMLSLGYPDRDISRYQLVATLDFDTALRLELLSAYRSGLRKGRLTEAQFLTELHRLGIREELVQAYLSQERLRLKLEDPTPEELELHATGSGVVIRRFREGWTTSSEFTDEMRSLGYTDSQIAQYEIVATLEADYDYRQDLFSYIRDAFRKDEISPDDFLDHLTTLGMSADRATVHLGREQVKKAPKPPAS